MASIIGTYLHEKNENLDEYFKAIGVPYIPRKMMGLTKPKLEIKKTDDDQWTIKTVTMMRTVELTFKIGEEFEESMPSGTVLKNTASLEDGGSIMISSTLPNGEKITRKYELKEDEIILTMTHEKSGQTAKRFFKRAA